MVNHNADIYMYNEVMTYGQNDAMAEFPLVDSNPPVGGVE